MALPCAFRLSLGGGTSLDAISRPFRELFGHRFIFYEIISPAFFSTSERRWSLSCPLVRLQPTWYVVPVYHVSSPREAVLVLAMPRHVYCAISPCFPRLLSTTWYQYLLVEAKEASRPRIYSRPAVCVRRRLKRNSAALQRRTQ